MIEWIKVEDELPTKEDSPIVALTNDIKLGEEERCCYVLHWKGPTVICEGWWDWSEDFRMYFEKDIKKEKWKIKVTHWARMNFPKEK